MSNIINPAVTLTAFAGQATNIATGKRDEAEGLRRSCQDFEAIMLKSMLKQMRATVPKDGLLDEGSDREMFEDMMDQEVAMRMSRDQGIGIADSLYRQLEKGLRHADEQ